MDDLADTVAAARSVLVVHAHPDDETLATGGLLAALAEEGAQVHVLTATRGEQGEIVPGSLTDAQARDLPRHREDEVACACAALGVTGRAFLGAPGARAGGRPSRRYTDSGMRWLDAAETIAGPGDSAGPDSLTSASGDELAADIGAYAASVRADLVITYDADGGYGHPDHVALHAPTRRAAALQGADFLEVASHPGADGLAVGGEQYRTWIISALRCYASQLTVDGHDVVHVGGQRQPIAVTCVLREPADQRPEA